MGERGRTGKPRRPILATTVAVVLTVTVVVLFFGRTVSVIFFLFGGFSGPEISGVKPRGNQDVFIESFPLCLIFPLVKL